MESDDLVRTGERSPVRKRVYASPRSRQFCATVSDAGSQQHVSPGALPPAEEVRCDFGRKEDEPSIGTVASHPPEDLDGLNCETKPGNAATPQRTRVKARHELDIVASILERGNEISDQDLVAIFSKRTRFQL
jgi:hypothetical protein